MKGFTLVETLVVVAITLVLSAIAITYNRSSESQIILYREQAVIVGLLNQAKSLSVQKYRDPALAGTYDFCAFGLHFDFGSPDFVLFQDLGEGGCGSADYRYVPGGLAEETLRTFSLDPKLEFEGIPAAGLDIFFIPPEVNASSSEGLPVSVVVKTTDGSFRTTITVASGGQIITE